MLVIKIIPWQTLSKGEQLYYLVLLLKISSYGDIGVKTWGHMQRWITRATTAAASDPSR